MRGPVKRYGVVTLFPEMFDAIADFGVTRRALDRQVWALDCINPRDFAKDAHRTVDDRPFGGGPGMVMMAEPLDAAIDRALELQRAGGVDRPKVVLFTPQASPLTDRLVRDLAAEAGLVMLCGRYEGIDERLVEARVDVSVSIGDFVLSGGELAAMVLIDAMVRLQPGVLNDGASAAEDSYAPGRDGLLDHPHYTRPEVWQGLAVPEVLTSGDHARIAAWRRKETLRRTLQRRPELMDGREWSKADLQFLAEIRAEAGRGG
ncbi:MAG TPA: tRNA (guanosine(37)-N1)-methyltransferase TrmD [Usitatibacteraceae bacterium]|nr:tRNA (guanosine(37)-N1)-methyltransferase TrmD [Usitatibacteraceae bacterium]